MTFWISELSKLAGLLAVFIAAWTFTPSDYAVAATTAHTNLTVAVGLGAFAIAGSAFALVMRVAR